MNELKQVARKLLFDSPDRRKCEAFYELIVGGYAAIDAVDTELGQISCVESEGEGNDGSAMRTIIKLGDSFYVFPWIYSGWGEPDFDIDRIEEVVHKEVTRFEWVTKDSE